MLMLLSLVLGMLDTRIRMQQVLTIANRLPHPDMHAVFASANSGVHTKFEAASAGTRELLQELFDIQHSLASQSVSFKPVEPFQAPAPAAAVANGGKASKKHGKRDSDHAAIDAYWQHVQQIHDSTVPVQDEIIDRWNKRIDLTSSAHAAGKSFKALNQVRVVLR